MQKHNHIRKNDYVSKVYTNISSEVVQITTDKLRIILKDYLESVAKRSSWHTPLGLVLTLFLSISTTEFKTTLGVNSSTWCAVFFMATILSAIWLIAALVGSRKVVSIEELISKMLFAN